MVKHKVPNIVRGGVALPLNKTNYYLVRGRKHEQGGIDIGKNPRTGLEVEDGEVVHVGDKELRVFSAQPILDGMSPSQLVIRGVNPDKVFAAQERFKQVNGINDDGTKAKLGKRKYIGSDEKTAEKQNADTRRQYWNYDTKLAQVVSDMSSQYNVDPRLVISRLSREGLIDSAIRLNNRIVQGKQEDGDELYDKSILDIEQENAPFANFGLDTIFDRYTKGRVKTNRPIFMTRVNLDNEAENVNSGYTDSMYDTLELFIAEIASRQKEVKDKYPKLSKEELLYATNANFNTTNKYFKQLMKDGTYKTKYKIEDDVKDINIPAPKSYKQKGSNVEFKNVDKLLGNDPDRDYAELMRNPEVFTIENKSYAPDFVLSNDSLLNRAKINYYNKETSHPYGTNYEYYNPYLDDNREEIKRLGGNMKHKLVEVNIGGNSRLIRVTKPSSTGESEHSEGLTRKRADIGTKTRKLEDGTVVPVYANILAENSTLENPIINPEFKKQERATNRMEAIKGFIESNPNSISDAIGIGSNIIGSLITKRINNKTLDNLTFQKSPVALMPSKLKTKININPQLDKMRESLADYERLISGNTASSRVALGRINRARNQMIGNVNELYGIKENTEASLINADKARQDEIMFRNLQQDYQYRAAKNAFENEVRNLKAENKVANVQNVVTGIQDLLARRDQRNMFNKTLTAETLANPNLPAEMYLKSGIWSKELYDMYRSQYTRKA